MSERAKIYVFTLIWFVAGFALGHIEGKHNWITTGRHHWVTSQGPRDGDYNFNDDYVCKDGELKHIGIVSEDGMKEVFIANGPHYQSLEQAKKRAERMVEDECGQSSER
jgi:hypothetical protein